MYWHNSILLSIDYAPNFNGCPRRFLTGCTALHCLESSTSSCLAYSYMNAPTLLLRVPCRLYVMRAEWLGWLNSVAQHRASRSHAPPLCGTNHVILYRDAVLLVLPSCSCRDIACCLPSGPESQAEVQCQANGLYVVE